MYSVRGLFGLPALAALPLLAAQPALRIGGVEVSQAQLKIATSAVQIAQGAELDANRAVRRAVDQLVVREVLAAAAREAKIAVDPGRVQAALAKQREQNGPEKFAKMLAETGLTEAELAWLETQRQLVQGFIEARFAPGVTVSEPEARAYFEGHPQQFARPERVKARVIVAELPPKADDANVGAAKVRIDAAYSRLQAGEDFGKVARDVSDHASRSTNGEVGWISRGMMPPEAEGPLLGLDPGTFSPPVKTQFGYFIFKVDEKMAASMDSFDTVRERLTKYLRDMKIGQEVQRFAASRSSAVQVEVLDPAIKAALAADRAGGTPPGPAPAPSGGAAGQGAPPPGVKPTDGPVPH